MKRILFMILMLCSIQLHARKITIIKTKSADKVTSLSYLSYQPKGRTIVLSKLKNISLHNKQAISFDIRNSHETIELVVHLDGEVLAGNIRLKPGSSPLTYKLSKIHNKIHLTPLILSPAKKI